MTDRTFIFDAPGSSTVAPGPDRGGAPMAGQGVHVRALAIDLLAVKPTLRPEDIEPKSSITGDLGFGSLELVALASRIRDRCPGFDWRRWLTVAVQSDVDSVESMAALLAEATRMPGMEHV